MCALVMLLVCQPLAAAQPDVQPGAVLAQRYPAGSIDSPAKAEQALEAVSKARTEIELAHAAEQRSCYPTFFTTSCLDKAAERRRQGFANLRPIEIEAEIFRRRTRVIERDRELADSTRKTLAEQQDKDQALSTPEPAGKPAKAVREASLQAQLTEQQKRDDKIRAYEKKQIEMSIKLREREAQKAVRPE
jgi:hypothetical protein